MHWDLKFEFRKLLSSRLSNLHFQHFLVRGNNESLFNTQLCLFYLGREARGQSLIQRTIMRAGTELVATEEVAAEVDYGISPRFANVKSSQILDMLALANELDKADPSGVPIIRWCASESGFDTPRPIVEVSMTSPSDKFCNPEAVIWKR